MSIEISVYKNGRKLAKPANYIEIEVDPHIFYDVVSERMSWRKLSREFLIQSCIQYGRVYPKAPVGEVVDRTFDLRKSALTELKKYYYKHKKLYTVGIAVIVKEN